MTWNDLINEGGEGYDPDSESSRRLDSQITREAAERETRLAAGTPTAADLRHEIKMARKPNPYHPPVRTYTEAEIVELEAKLEQVEAAEAATRLAGLSKLSEAERERMYTN